MLSPGVQTQTKTNSESSQKTADSRLMSLDVLRGFDMFMLCGGAVLVMNIIDYLNWPPLIPLKNQFEHVDWNGFHLWDLVFPLFLFVAGAAMPFSFEKRLEAGAGKRDLILKSLKRCAFLILLCWFHNDVLKLDFLNMRWTGVLALIGVSWFIASAIFIYTGTKGRLLYIAFALLGFWAVMTLVPVPGFAAGQLTREGNLSGFIDRALLPGQLYEKVHDPEGPLLFIPASALALIGAVIGSRLKSKNTTVWNKVLLLVISGTACVLIGLIWNTVFPINKKMWTSSFVVFTAGLSILLLTLFYIVIDVWDLRKWVLPFLVFGLNPVLIYIVPGSIIDFELVTKSILGGLISHSGTAGPVIDTAGVLLFEFLFLYFLYKNKLFFRV